MLQVFYGRGQTFADVTAHAFRHCFDGERIYIPSGDTGCLFFPDPLYGYAKTIVAIRTEDGKTTCQQFYSSEEVRIPASIEDERRAGVDRQITPGYSRRIMRPPAEISSDERIQFYHSQLTCFGGDITHEWREQSMVVNFMNPDAKVLEIGANIGRNTLMISCVLNDERNLVSLECNPFFIELLRNNRFANGFHFHIEPSALSYRRLIQSQQYRQYGSEAEAWETIPSEELPDGYDWISTITFEQLTAKYQLEFDTLVADCEGALYYILQDNPNIVENMQTVILESDYRIAGQKEAVEKIFARFGLEKVHAEALYPNLTALPQECADSFWEVWMRRPRTP